MSAIGSTLPGMQIHPLTADRMDDLTDLFESNGTTRGCWCTWFLRTRKDNQAGWGEGNRDWFLTYAAAADPPVGVLGYCDELPVGWCAVSPRARYAALGPRSIMRDRDRSEDDVVWLVTCFFVRVGARRAGSMSALLTAAVELAARHGATAIEGFPMAGGGDTQSGYVGFESVFAAAGFDRIGQPSPRRVIMRREL